MEDLSIDGVDTLLIDDYTTLSVNMNGLFTISFDPINNVISVYKVSDASTVYINLN